MTTEVIERVHGRGKGFASMSEERRRELASLGGRTAHAMGRAHRWTVDEAREQGRKAAGVRWAKREEVRDE